MEKINKMMYWLIKRVLVFVLLIITLTAFAQENNRLSSIEENQGWTTFNGKISMVGVNTTELKCLSIGKLKMRP